MRRFTSLVTTLSFTLSGLFISPASTAELVQLSMGASTLNVSTAIPATFGANVQNAIPDAYFNSISCPSAGNCVAAGQFRNIAGDYEAFTQTQTSGSWANAIPATFGANVQNASPSAYFWSTSCSSAGNCTAAGMFKNATGGYEPFTQSITGSIEAPPVAPPVVTPAPNVVTPALTAVTSKATSIKLPIFYTGSGELTVSQKTALKSLVSKSGKKATFVITGSAGKLPGVSDPAVKALAKKRGEIAKAYLVKLGVSKSKITIQVKITNQGIVPKTKILAKYSVSQ